MKYIIIIGFLFCSFTSIGQQKIDNSFGFPNSTSLPKSYSLYIPSSYDAANPNGLLIGFHPFNTANWNSKTWRDTLINLAESRDLIVACPDGGPDGRVDDQLDYDFTTALLDSMNNWYNIDADRIFAIGFSVGGKATYEYGLENASVFRGFIPVGAAITGTSSFQDNLASAQCKAFYLVHGENDSPGTRYTPAKDSLISNKAEVDFIFMAGIGHTWNFPSRELILRTAFDFIDTVVCKNPIPPPTSVAEIDLSDKVRLFPTLLNQGESLNLNAQLPSGSVLNVTMFDANGKKQYATAISIDNARSTHTLHLGGLDKGIYIVQLSTSNTLPVAQRIIVK